MKLIYITADPMQARTVQDAGVACVMVDLEINGKDARQGHLNTVISRHSLEDVAHVRAVLSTAELMVRVNPVFDGSSAEVEACLARGADRLMLPMFRHPQEVAAFLEIVAGRVPVTLLVETATALARLPQILDIDGVDDVHFGLNDLHLELKLDFMFEVLSGGLMDHAAALCRARGVPFGIGGVARLGQPVALPAELILSEHLRLGSSAVILSRDFQKALAPEMGTAPARAFSQEIAQLHHFVQEAGMRPPAATDHDQAAIRTVVGNIVSQIREQRQP